MKVSVLMPNYNNGLFIGEAVKSILNQTFEDFELLIVDDASTDDSIEQLEQFSDSRIKLIQRNQNGGIVEALNDGIEHSQGEYIVRMDADDVSKPERLASLVHYLDDHKEVGVVSSWLETFGSQEEVWKYNAHDNELKIALLFGSPVPHAPSAFRKSVFINNNIRYTDIYPQFEDYMLFSALSRCTSFHIIPQNLYEYRFHGKNITVQNENAMKQRYLEVYKTVLEPLIGGITEDELRLHYRLSKGQMTILDLSNYSNWKERLFQGIPSEDKKILTSELKKRIIKSTFFNMDSSIIRGFMFGFKSNSISLNLLKYALSKVV